MKRNKLSKRSVKFLERNSPFNESVKKYITKLAEDYFGFKFFDFVLINKELCLQIKHQEVVFVFSLNREFIELQLYENNIKIQSFLGDSCWYQGLKFVSEKIQELK